MSEFKIEKLRKPIEAHGKTLTSLTLREPEGGDVMDLGAPMSIETSGGKAVMRPDLGVVGAYISRLGDIPLSSVRKLHPVDLSKAAGWLNDFFEGSEVET